jgi:hypothetical protein
VIPVKSLLIAIDVPTSQSAVLIDYRVGGHQAAPHFSASRWILPARLCALLIGSPCSAGLHLPDLGNSFY